MSKISQAKRKVLDNFEGRNDDWSHGDFERELEKSMGKRYKNYQDAKMTIIEAHHNGSWPKTVKSYLRSNHASFGNLPVELISIAQDIGLFKTDTKYS